MPFPLIPIGDTNSYNNIFPNNQPQDEVALASRYFKKEDGQKDIISLLEEIDKYQDNIVSAASNAVSGNNDIYYTVPPNISDEALLRLKGEGYCHGHGRTVRFSEKAQKALKLKYLGTENELRKSRVKKKIL